MAGLPNHLLVSCPFSRSLWHKVLSWIQSTCVPPTADVLFADWWQATVSSTLPQLRKGTASLIMLTAWWIWKHRNVAIFDIATFNIALLTELIKTGAKLWASAGAVGLGALLPTDY